MTAQQEHATLIDLFLGTVRTHPDRPAVTDDRQTLTYTEVARRSAAVAAALRAAGVRPEDRVGLYVDRGVDVMVAILGIVRAGAAYVAVDSRYPDARRDLMLQASGARVVLAEAGWEDRLAGLGVTVMTVAAVDESDPVPDGLAKADNAASVLFTSGSSGTPKAIVLEHRNLVSFATNPAMPALRPADRVGQISSLSFDAFNFELWSTLAAGAEMVVLPPVPDLLVADFQREMRRRRISAMLVPTMVVNHVVREDRDAFAPLRLLQAGGDVLLPSACRDLFAGAFAGELYNLYGPAEITTACTAHRVTQDDVVAGDIPIGRPLEGVRVHLLDENRAPVPAGQIGEIYVAGPGVARGYLDRPDLTDERFVPDPFGGTGRLYRTGDLARTRPDGVLEFVGRADTQVKVRGYRIELSEVEQSLRSSDGVHDAVVLPTGDGDDRSLVAFVVLEETTDLKELRAYAEAKLPDFMVPSAIVALPQIPANEHGKRDMEALQAELTAMRERRERYVAPETETERYLADLWASLLSVEQVGRDDDFFALGGHSLLAFRLRARIKRDLSVSVEHKAILRNAVLSAVAKTIDDAREGADLL